MKNISVEMTWKEAEEMGAMIDDTISLEDVLEDAEFEDIREEIENG